MFPVVPPRPRARVAGRRPLVSVVIPAFNEAACVPELGRRLAGVFASLADYDFECVVVDNGSTDDTFDLLVGLHEKDPRFKVVQMSRTFGTDGGVTAGLRHINGDCAVIMNADLQDPPEMIDQFLARWEEGYDNVYGVVTKRTGTGPIRRMNSQLYYWILGIMTAHAIPPNASDFRLVDRALYETINRLDERARFMRGLWAWAGFPSIGVEHVRAERFAGETKAKTRGVLITAMNGIYANSRIPLKVIPVLGVLLSFGSFAVIVALAVNFLINGVPFPGFGSLICLTLLMFGFLFLVLGVISEYIGLIYDEVKQRPNFVVRSTVGLD